VAQGPELALHRPGPMYTQIADAIRPVLLPDDRLATEGLGQFGYALPDHYIHDFFGLTDEHIAHHGINRDVYGRFDYGYTINTIRPAIIVLQSGQTHIIRGFKKFTPVPFEQLYETYRLGPTAPVYWHQMMVCIPQGRVPRFLPTLERFNPERFVVEP